MAFQTLYPIRKIGTAGAVLMKYENLGINGQSSNCPVRIGLRIYRSTNDLVGRAPALETENDDAQLMRRIAARDESALAAIYDRHSGIVYSLLRRMLRDTSDAEDILQDVFFRLWEIAARFDAERGSLRGWLLVIARNRAISLLRQRPQTDSDDIEERPMVNLVPQDTAAAQNEMVATVQKVLAEFPAEQKELFELAFFEGMTHSEIAERTGQPLGTVKTRLRTTLTSIRRAFRQ